MLSKSANEQVAKVLWGCIPIGRHMRDRTCQIRLVNLGLWGTATAILLGTSVVLSAVSCVGVSEGP